MPASQTSGAGVFEHTSRRFNLCRWPIGKVKGVKSALSVRGVPSNPKHFRAVLGRVLLSLRCFGCCSSCCGGWCFLSFLSGARTVREVITKQNEKLGWVCCRFSRDCDYILRAQVFVEVKREVPVSRCCLQITAATSSVFDLAVVEYLTWCVINFNTRPVPSAPSAGSTSKKSCINSCRIPT